ncbi:hypothetical protein QBC38DRAFT_231464 [Podospora fimiseda]|uniref:Uncharacterized protein n=1 Tax=Podospora fimiseda TaxID=252190 RepID=A0AAN7BMZ6_9PEZI|nr:hypothetical protein QBC38DRAFT_231464 [Podospora fimiseda]
MALINPVHGLVVPFLCIFTIPMAIFASMTSAFAFSVLMFRVAVVYLDIALALVPQYFRGRSKRPLPPPDRRRHYPGDGWRSPGSPPGSAGSYSGYSSPSPIAPFPQTTGYLSSGYISPNQHRRNSSYGFSSALRRNYHRRSSSQVSLGTSGTITPIHEDFVLDDIAPTLQSTANAAATSSIGLDRDFEGVGGWRLDDDNDEGDDWTNINSRLELPLERSSFSRHSQRSQSVGPLIPSESQWLMMRNSLGASKGSSQNSSRIRMNQNIAIRTPLTPMDSETGSWVQTDKLSPRSPRKAVP